MNETEARALRLHLQTANVAHDEARHRAWAYYDHQTEARYDAWREAARVARVLEENLGTALAMIEQRRVAGDS